MKIKLLQNESFEIESASGSKFQITPETMTQGTNTPLTVVRDEIGQLADRVAALDTSSIDDFASLKQAFLDLIIILTTKPSVAGQ